MRQLRNSPHRKIHLKCSNKYEYPRIFADFHNADEQSRLRLNCVGTIEDLSRQNIKLQNGQLLTLYSEELEVDGVVQYSEEEVFGWQQLIGIKLDR